MRSIRAVLQTARDPSACPPSARAILYVAPLCPENEKKGISTMKNVLILTSALLFAPAVPAFCSVAVTAPLNGASLVSPFALTASATPCSSQRIAAMGYSIDSSSNTTVVPSNSVQAQVTATPGAHVLHVKSWGNKGASCVTNVAINIGKAPASSAPPATAIKISGIHALPTWKAEYDTATGTGGASGVMSLVSGPSVSGTARQFIAAYTAFGGERFHVSFGADANAHNFLYDTWIYVAAPNSDIGNIEMDMNQTAANGQTIIFGVQCDGWSGTWDYTTNAGTAQKPLDQWLHSNQSCNPRQWSTNTWHHVQMSYSRDDQGYVTYKSVWLDGAEQELNVTTFSSFALGWGPALLTNLQIDGIGASGSSTVYLDNLSVTRW